MNLLLPTLFASLLPPVLFMMPVLFSLCNSLLRLAQCCRATRFATCKQSGRLVWTFIEIRSKCWVLLLPLKFDAGQECPCKTLCKLLEQVSALHAALGKPFILVAGLDPKRVACQTSTEGKLLALVYRLGTPLVQNS